MAFLESDAQLPQPTGTRANPVGSCVAGNAGHAARAGNVKSPMAKLISQAVRVGPRMSRPVKTILLTDVGICVSQQEQSAG
jgi:hypothetical protein